MWRAKFHKYLKEAFEQSQETNPKFSLRAFAKYNSLSAGITSELLSGKKGISSRFAKEVLPKLKSLSPSQRGELERLLDQDSHIEVKVPLKDLISNWQTLAVLSSLEIDGSPQEISERLQLDVEEVKREIDKLVGMGLAKQVGLGVYEAVGAYIKTTEDVPNEVIQAAHWQELSLAQKALSKVPVEERDFVSYTFCGSSKKLNKAKKLTRAYLKKMTDLMQGPDEDQIYKVGVQIFPLSGRLEREDS